MTSQLIQHILIIMDEHTELQGTEHLALMTGSPKFYVIKCARILQQDGTITIIPSRGGRGRKTVYRRNRNQPGVPRRQR